MLFDLACLNFGQACCKGLCALEEIFLHKVIAVIAALCFGRLQPAWPGTVVQGFELNACCTRKVGNGQQPATSAVGFHYQQVQQGAMHVKTLAYVAATMASLGCCCCSYCWRLLFGEALHLESGDFWQYFVRLLLCHNMHG
jgi:hypothetical protein